MPDESSTEGAADAGYDDAGTPTFESVRDKIEARYATAQGSAELDAESPEGRSVEAEYDERVARRPSGWPRSASRCGATTSRERRRACVPSVLARCLARQRHSGLVAKAGSGGGFTAAGRPARRSAGRRRAAPDDLGEELPGVTLRHRRDVLRSAFRDNGSASAPPSGPMSTIQSEVLMTSRLCSMTMTVLPLSTRPLMTLSNLRMSSKCRPVVGSSRMYTVRPVDRFCSSAASFTRCASPPDSVGAGWPSRT